MEQLPTMLQDRKHASAYLGRVLVLGLGKSGKSAARYCLNLLGSRVEMLTIAAGSLHEDAQDFVNRELEGHGVEVLFEQYDFTEHYDLCIASPGISQFSDFYQNAQSASTELIGEVEFAWRESKRESRWLAITGTNGKTTTTALTAHILRTMGFAAAAVGNIGDTCLEAVVAGQTDIYVVETSSYQLASIKNFAPEVAVILNITPDHLSWHKSHEAYVEAKLNILKNLGASSETALVLKPLGVSTTSNMPSAPSALAVLDATDDTLRKILRSLKALTPTERGFSYLPLGAASGLHADMRKICGSENAAFVDGGMLKVCFGKDEYSLLPVSDLKIKGAHNIANALAASGAALAIKRDVEALRAALLSFEALEHRIEPVTSIRGVFCYNDSKATNVDASIKALSAFGEVRPIVLLGGYDKGTNLDPLIAEAEKHAQALVCFGAAGPRFFEALSKAKVPVYLAPQLESALDLALSIAQSGDIVLLSPACASFDEFTSFEQRGKVFKELVFQRSLKREL